MSGGEAHVENSIWMRAVLIGGVFLAIGVLAFATMGVGVANVKHHAYEELSMNTRMPSMPMRMRKQLTQVRRRFHNSKQPRKKPIITKWTPTSLT